MKHIKTLIMTMLISMMIFVSIPIGVLASDIDTYTQMIESNTFYDVLAWNKAIFNQNPTDDESLAFFLLPSAEYDDNWKTNRVESDHPEIIRHVQSIINRIPRNQRTDYNIASAINTWVHNNIEYDFQHLYYEATNPYYQPPEGYDSALFTLRHRRGVCMGIANLSVGLLRAAGIPARVVGGDVISARADSSIPDDLFDLEVNHVWHEAFIDYRWIIMDAGFGFFDISIEEISEMFIYDIGFLFNVTPSQVIFPESITRVRDGMFAYNTRIERIVLAHGVTRIGRVAFLNCVNLTHIFIPSSVIYIGEYAFWNTPLLTIYGEANSYAELYAVRHGIPFVAVYTVSIYVDIFYYGV